MHYHADTINQTALLKAILPLAKLNGWNETTLIMGAKSVGADHAALRSAFPDGAVSAVEQWAAEVNTQLTVTLRTHELKKMKIPGRVTTAVRARLELLEPNRRAALHAWRLLSPARHPLRYTRSLFSIADAIWIECGDTATGFDYYSKRVMLGLVYRSTHEFWLEDKTAGSVETWALLDRNISRVMRIQTAKWKLVRFAGRVLNAVHVRR